jgi:hypothetical protein
MGASHNSDYTISADKAEGQWIRKTFLLKKGKTPAKKIRLLFCHRTAWQRKRFASKKFLRSVVNSHVRESPGAWVA